MDLLSNDIKMTNNNVSTQYNNIIVKMSSSKVHSVMPSRDYALEDLKAHLERVRNGENVTFYLYTVGGGGQVYDEEKIGIMREFISLGGQIDPNQWTSKWPGVTALHTANCHGNQPMIDFLIELGGNPESFDCKGRRPKDCWFDEHTKFIMTTDENGLAAFQKVE